jgi:hypothetical protein
MENSAGGLASRWCSGPNSLLTTDEHSRCRSWLGREEGDPMTDNTRASFRPTSDIEDVGTIMTLEGVPDELDLLAGWLLRVERLVKLGNLPIVAVDVV